ncbi:transposase [Hymenobacter algoricola]|uniref:Transposase IS200-like domain-containing protein n=1 Tax=Hymenobacter algoricola TaxID=486267 RepID=A0ABP7NLP4_9BACT
MQFVPQQPYHVYNRGNNRETVFFEPANYLYFLRKVRQHIVPHSELLAYCLMPNHFHLLLCPLETPQTIHPLYRGVGTALSSYTQGVNQDRKRTGSLFQAKTKAQPLAADEAYLRTCFRYIHQNPVRAGLVGRLEDWPSSSYRDYAGLRSGSLCNQAVAHGLIDLPQSSELFRREAENMIPPEYVMGQ